MLKDWTLTYLKNRDVLLKRISKIEDLDQYLLVSNKDETHIVVIVKENISDIKPILDQFRDLEKKHKADKLTLVVLNQKENVNMVVKEWEKLIVFPTLSIVFANPKANSRWIIAPYVHNRIADPKNLKQGIMSMFQEVEPYY
ncbi:hypothetical protein KY335_03425 [Candidatus Woesearchaeota archaeon]|nr:hypothetical protein [Candidatus Woesearchaeota archaeon]MBW3014268.1 hypothetical protein [Candidatus Woesearchaeota archaeon]